MTSSLWWRPAHRANASHSATLTCTGQGFKIRLRFLIRGPRKEEGSSQNGATRLCIALRNHKIVHMYRSTNSLDNVEEEVVTDKIRCETVRVKLPPSQTSSQAP